MAIGLIINIKAMKTAKKQTAETKPFVEQVEEDLLERGASPELARQVVGWCKESFKNGIEVGRKGRRRKK